MMSEEPKARPTAMHHDGRTNEAQSSEVEQMRVACQTWRNDSRGRPILAGSLYNRLLLRQISIYVTRWCVRNGISADAATIAMTTMGMIGCMLSVPHSMGYTALAGAAFFLFDLFDAVDGEIARWNKTSSTRGLFLDQLSHLVVDYPSRGLAAVHLYVWTHEALYLGLAIASVGSSLLARTVSEIGKRINAETLLASRTETETTSPPAQRESEFKMQANRWKSWIVATHPLVKARLVQLLTLTGILLAYAGIPQLLVGLSWFYAIYTTVWLLLEVPYYCKVAVVDAEHTKPCDSHERWPI